ncbi:MAG TPA: hydroxymethylbilane synthase [Pirellulales bacterium]
MRIGTRGSPLARWQADWVAAGLRARGHTVELVPISTRGDRQQVGPIGQIAGGDGVFTKELQRALLAGEIDLAVHSLKDLPTEPVAGLALAAVPPRAPNGDVLVSPQHSVDELPQGAIVGTGSLRRRAQLLHRRADLQMVGVRGNVETRLAKLERGEYAALVLAEAGLLRLGLERHISQRLPKTLMLPAVGQGALGIEARADDEPTRAVLAQLDDPDTRAAVTAERAMLARLSGGCLAPVGAWGRWEAGRLALAGVVLSVDGAQRLAAELVTDAAHAGGSRSSTAAELGRQVADALLAQGAAELIDEARRQGA